MTYFVAWFGAARKAAAQGVGRLSLRKASAVLLAACFGFAAPLSAAGSDALSGQAAFPKQGRPITLIVTFPPGGGTDLLARKLAPYLEAELGVPVVVENRPGASGNIGARAVALAKPDGHTLLVVNSSFAVNPGVYSDLGFSPTEDFQAVVNIAWIPSVLVANPNSGLQDVGELVERSRQDQIPVGSCGNGTPQHLAIQMLRDAGEANLQHIPYKGCGPAVTDVLGGTVPVAMVTLSSALPFIHSERLVALGVTAEQRSHLLPSVPTVAESEGMQGYHLNQWHGILAPAATPVAVLDSLGQAFNKVVHSSKMQDDLHELGYASADMPRQEFQVLIHNDIRRFGELTARMGLKVD